MASISRLPSGKWRARVRVAGVYRGQSFDTRKQATAWAAEVEGLVDSASVSGLSAVPKTATASDLIGKYTESVPNRWGKTKTASLKMLDRELGTVRLSALNAAALRDFIDARAKQGAGGVTIAGDLSILSAVLKWARSARQLDVDPRVALDARASLPHRGLDTRSQEREREPTDAELAILYAHWASKPRMRNDMRTVCEFLLATAMRLGEVCSLRIEDIDPTVPSIVVRDRKDPRRKKGNTQTVPLLPEAWAIAQRMQGERNEGQLFAGLTTVAASAAFTRACTDCGIEDLHLHDLRHRGTADLFRKGLDIPRVALMTGHKTWQMLRRYTAITPADVLDHLKARA
jgi:integrase